MVHATSDENVFLSSFHRLENRLNADIPPWVRRLRKAAISQFENLGLPSTRLEEWRFTDMGPLREIPFEPAQNVVLAPSERMPPLSVPPVGNRHRVTFVDGRYRSDLSSTGRLPEGVTLGSLADVLRRCPESLESYLGRYASYREHAFTALNTAFVDDGAFVHVAKGVVVDDPIELLFLSTAPGEATVLHPRNLIVAEEQAELRVLENYSGHGDNVYFTNAVTEVAVEAGGKVDHCKLQRETEKAFHMATLQVHQQRDSHFGGQLLSLGGSLVRHETNVVMDAVGGRCELDGLFIADRQQHMDCRTRVEHAKPHCNSRELYKGILDGRSEGVFNGKIIVQPDAQKTDARQNNQVLLLSSDAAINTKPQLEIFADDVKCTHGATVGQLDAEAMFYLQSRGISRPEARNLLISAFANELVGRIREEELRADLEAMLLARGNLTADAGTKEAV